MTPMRAEQLGELLLTQACLTWNEDEADDDDLGPVYWLAQLLRGRHLKDQEVCLEGDSASMSQVADVVDKLDVTTIPSCWADYRERATKLLRNPTKRSGLVNKRLDLTQNDNAERYLGKPLE